MGNALVIVESPAKARTISRYLGSGYQVESSIGHIRDLPRRAADVPERLKKEKWTRLGVDVDNEFTPLYIVPAEKRAQVKKLKSLLKKADELYLATDEDREGEAIAWHLAEVLSPKVPVKRMVFGEITESAIKKAVEETRDIDHRLVNAQEARRVLDRLYGYEVSPVLWRKVRPRLSAGRVQSVATRLVVDRERARRRFHEAEYWDLVAELESPRDERRFEARLVDVGGTRVAQGRDFEDETGKLKNDVLCLDQQRAETLRDAVKDQPFRVVSVQEKPFSRKPYAPFITSTMQQEAGRKLGMSAQRAMQVAQGLYENGYITYMRTDSVSLSRQAIEAARAQIAGLYGANYLPESPRSYASSNKNAQEAHEAIRPTGETFRQPSEVKGDLDSDAYRLYELIWKRTVASQMKNAQGMSTSVRLEVSAEDGVAGFSASGRVLKFPGFLRAYVEGSDDPGAALEDQEKLLPELNQGDQVPAREVRAVDHRTQPPARFTEASLVKELEVRGIGRPSTYASILQTIQDRGYVWKKGSALVPTFTAFAVTRLLEEHLSTLVDFDFTARMEGDLDAIAAGQREWVPYLEEFYFGDREIDADAPANENGSSDSQDADVDRGLKEMIGIGWDEIDARAICSIPIGKLEEELVSVRVGRYGPYLQVGDSDRRVTIADDIPPDEMTLDKATELLERAAQSDRSLGEDPETSRPVFIKTGRFGDYVQLGEPELDDKGKIKPDGKPKMASLWPSMSPASIDLDQALMLLSFPREVGKDPESGDAITAQDGRFGPYLKRGSDTRSLETHEQMATITLEQAVELFKQPKRRGRAASAVLKTFGNDPEHDLEISLKNGRFGPYVTDGVVNASVPKGQNPDDVDLARAIELLRAREQKLRDQGKDPRAPKKKAAKKKAKKKRKTTRKKKSA